MSPKIIIDWHLQLPMKITEDAGKAPSEKNDNDLEEGEGRTTSDEE
jgi:hypothetical protein